jgi:hypothetical protein
MSNLRIGQPIQGEWVVDKNQDGTMTLGNLWADREGMLIGEAIIRAIEEAGEALTRTAIKEAIAMKIQTLRLIMELKKLIKADRLVADKTTSGKKGGRPGYVYRLPQMTSGGLFGQ